MFSPIIVKTMFWIIDIAIERTPSNKKIKAYLFALSIIFLSVNNILSMVDMNMLKTGYMDPNIPDVIIPITNNI
jgi:hypothetical protein